MIGCLPFGICWIRETSKSPKIVSCNERGIGVAVIARKCGAVIFCPSAVFGWEFKATFSRSFWRCATPKRCCSSIIQSERRENWVSSVRIACVPTIKSILPSLICCLSGSFCLVAPIRRAVRMPKGASRCSRFSACWEAKIAVGASIATCAPCLIAWKAARAATIVLPEPTSPCRRRFIGVVLVRSWRISHAALFWASVRVKGSEERNCLVRLKSKDRGSAFNFWFSCLLSWLARINSNNSS